MPRTTPQLSIITILFLSLELSKKKWLLTFGAFGKSRRREIDAGDIKQLKSEIAFTRKHFELPDNALVVCCYEAGRDGFWIHRMLTQLGIQNFVVDSSSIEVNRRKRRTKNDKIDGSSLLRMLIRYHGGEKEVWSVVRVPDEEAEDARRPHREIERLKKERNAQSVRIEALLALQGVHIPVRRDFCEKLKETLRPDGKPLPEHLKGEVVRQYKRIELADEQLAELEAMHKKELEAVEARMTQKIPAKKPQEKWLEQIIKLSQLKGIGKSARVLVKEFFGWRDFKNGRQVGALAGLTGTPYSSGNSQREQGISKAGNRRVRALMVELAWLWLRYQPESKISFWYHQNFGPSSKRSRRVGIVAVARKLLVALWRYLERGEIPEGADLKSA